MGGGIGLCILKTPTVRLWRLGLLSLLRRRHSQYPPPSPETGPQSVPRAQSCREMYRLSSQASSCRLTLPRTDPIER